MAPRDVTCDHTTLDCFGKLYRIDPYMFTGIYKDDVFRVELSFEVKNQLEVVYFGLDGIIKETVEYIPELTMPNGETLEERFMLNPSAYLTYGSKLYFYIATEALGADEALELGESEVEFVHWIVSYDLEEKKWDLVTSIPYLLPDNIINIVDVNDTKFSFSENGIGYTVDYITGETEAFDCAVIIDEMIESGKLPVGSILDDVYPLRDCFGCFADNKYSHYRISTREPLDASEITYITDSSKFSYDGEQYALDLRQVCTNVNTGVKTEIALDGTTIIFLCETENGIIFKYLERLEDGNLEPQTYIVEENGKDVVYWYPSKYVYATKADIMDGQIDEPWYYDAETYSFIRQ